MTIEFDNERGTSGTITRRPSWLGRLFGGKPHVAHFHRSRDDYDWRFSYDGAWVGTDLTKALDEERRWRTLGDLPTAVLEPPK